MKSTTKLATICTLLTVWFFGCSNNKYQNLSAEEFSKAITEPNTIIVDVRTPEEYNEGHIAGAKNIDVKSCTFIDKAEETIGKTQTIAVYCRSGKRSANAASILAEHGYKKIINLKGGIIEWQEAQKAVEK